MGTGWLACFQYGIIIAADIAFGEEWNVDHQLKGEYDGEDYIKFDLKLVIIMLTTNIALCHTGPYTPSIHWEGRKRFIVLVKPSVDRQQSYHHFHV